MQKKQFRLNIILLIAFYILFISKQVPKHWLLARVTVNWIFMLVVVISKLYCGYNILKPVLS